MSRTAGKWKRMSLNADTNTPSIVVLYFRPKVSIVVHRKRAIEMFSKFPEGTKTNSGFRRQSMLLISYAWVPRKCHRKQLIYLERMDHRRRINEVLILRKFIVTADSGVDAKLFYTRSNHEDDQHFRGYRAYAHSSVFAFLNKTGLDGACTHPVKEICLQGKAEFKKVNKSLLMIEIFNVAVNDSGKYKVVALFSYTHNDTETEKCLQVHHLNVSGKQWIC